MILYPIKLSPYDTFSHSVSQNGLKLMVNGHLTYMYHFKLFFLPLLLALQINKMTFIFS
jgi:hypothetical protein